MTQAQRRGNISRGQETETLWHSGNKREWGHWLVVSYLGRRAYQQKSTTSSTLPTSKCLKSLPFRPLFLFPQNLCFLSSKMYNEKKNPALPYTDLVFQRLKGTLFRFCLWFAGTPLNDETATKNTNTEQWRGKRTRGDKNMKPVIK